MPPRTPSAFACCLWLAAAAAAGDRPATRPVLGLDDAIAIALEHNLSLASAALDVEVGDRRAAAARSRRLPSLEFQAFTSGLLTPLRVSYPAGGFGVFDATGPIPADDIVVESEPRFVTDLSARVSQPLSQLYRLNLGVRISELERDADDERRRAVADELESQVRQLYYQILQAESALEAAAAQRRALEELDRVLLRQLAEEAVLEHQSLDVKARLAAAGHNLLAGRNALATVKEQFNLLLGRDPDGDFLLQPQPPPTPLELTLEAAEARADAARPELVAARLRVRQAELARRIKRAELLPDLSLMVGYHTFFNAELLPRNFGQVGLVVSWDPFDWRRRREQLAATAATLMQARHAVTELEREVAVEVRSGYRQLGEARSLLEVRKLGQDAANARLRVTMNRFEEQAALLGEVLEAQAAVAVADDRYRHAQLALWQAKAAFDRAVGGAP